MRDPTTDTKTDAGTNGTSLENRELLLLTPGPTILPPEVRRALAAPMPHHREPRFRAMLRDCLVGLQEMLHTEEGVALLACSGRGGLEASLVNAFSPGDTIIACTNGHFGQMFARIAADLGFAVREAATDWTRPVDPDEVREALARWPEARGVLVIHSETSTGVLNDVAALAATLADADRILVVDAMSSMGSVEIDMRWGLDAVVGCSQKGLMSPPGVSVVAVGERFMVQMRQARFPRSYWDLERALRSLAQDPPETNNTAAVPVIAGMAAALGVLRRAGYETAYRRQATLAARTREALRAMRLPFLSEHLDERFCSPTVTTVRCPDGIASVDVLQCARERFGVMFQRGLGRFAEMTVRIGHLGTVGAADVARGLEALDGTLALLGAPCPRGAWRSVIEGEGEDANIRTVR